MNAARTGLVHVGMSSAHPIAITADTGGTLYMSGLADDPIDIDRAVAAAEGQAYFTAARILFAAKQVALHEAEQHTAQREAAQS